jgi:NADH-quinone oxidoreductase subunit A
VVDPVLIAGYLALFVAVGAVFLAVNLIVGWLVRPRMPNTEKLEVYECGEPAIGSSFVQFDLRFYVVALLFIIFDVEVAVFFPWATVFGKATQLSDPSLVSVVAAASADGEGDATSATEVDFESAGQEPGSATVLIPTASDRLALSAAGEGLFRELGFRDPAVPVFSVPTRQAAGLTESLRSVPEREGHWAVQRFGSLLARTAISDMVVFYAVLLIGFAYVWYRGDLDWVRAVSAARGRTPIPEPLPQRSPGSSATSVLSA